MIGFLPTANVQALLACRGSGIPVIVAERAWPELLQLSPLQRMFRDRHYAQAHRVIVQTQEGADWYLQRLGLRNLAVIPNGITLPYANREPVIEVDSVVPRDAQVLLHVGRLAEPKSPEAVIAAFAEGLGSDPNWHCVVIGEGPKRPLIAEAIARTGLGARLHLIGEAGNLGGWYKRAAVAVSASRFEGFPNVLLEAMAHGVVCVAWNCKTEPAEIIREGENGFLVPVGDTHLLAQRLKALADDTALRHRLAEAAQRVTDEFSDTRFFAA